MDGQNSIVAAKRLMVFAGFFLANLFCILHFSKNKILIAFAFFVKKNTKFRIFLRNVSFAGNPSLYLQCTLCSSVITFNKVYFKGSELVLWGLNMNWTEIWGTTIHIMYSLCILYMYNIQSYMHDCTWARRVRAEHIC